jgi:hypothetical protein
MDVIGYRFDTESAALAAQTSLNEHYGIPVNASAGTQNTSGVTSGVDADTGANVWYIRREAFSSHLGDSVTISLEDGNP